MATVVASHLQGSGTNAYYGGTSYIREKGNVTGERESGREGERERELGDSTYLDGCNSWARWQLRGDPGRTLGRRDLTPPSK